MRVVPLLTVKIWPVSSFSGRHAALHGGRGRVAPGPGPLPRRVDGVGVVSLSCASSCNETSVRWLFSQRVFQNTSLPLKKARFTPASRARLDVGALRT